MAMPSVDLALVVEYCKCGGRASPAALLPQMSASSGGLVHASTGSWCVADLEGGAVGRSAPRRTVSSIGGDTGLVKVDDAALLSLGEGNLRDEGTIVVVLGIIDGKALIYDEFLPVVVPNVEVGIRRPQRQGKKKENEQEEDEAGSEKELVLVLHVEL